MFCSLLLVARAETKNGASPLEGYSTSIGFLRSCIGMKATNNIQLKLSLQRLQRTLVDYDIFNEKLAGRQWRSVPLLGEVRISESGKVDFWFSKTIQDAISAGGEATVIDLNIVRLLKSRYSIALYELCLAHMETGYLDLPVDWVRKFMGIDEGKYQSCADMKRYVLSPATTEVTEKTDVDVTSQLTRAGRGGKTAACKFNFARKANKTVACSGDLERTAMVCALLPKQYSGEPSVIAAIRAALQVSDMEIVESNVRYFAKRIQSGLPAPDRPAAYLKNVFANDYGKEIREAEVVSKLIAEKKKQPKAPSPNLDLFEDAAYLAEMQRYMEYFEALGTEQQEEIRAITSKAPYVGPSRSKIVCYLKDTAHIIL